MIKGSLQTGIGYGRWLLQTICTGLLFFASSCTYGDTDRYSAKGQGKVFVSLDWRGQTPSDKTLCYFYPSDSDTPIERTGSGTGYEGVLPAGTYQVVIVNADYRNMRLQTDKGYEKAYAYGVLAESNTAACQTRREEPFVILPPDNFFGAGLTDIHVNGSADAIYTASLRALVHPVLLNLLIKGTDKIANVEAMLTGVSPSVHIPSGQASYDGLVAVSISLEKVDDEYYRSRQTVFGLTPEMGEEYPAKQNLLSLGISLSDGTMLNNELDITELINEAVAESGSVSGNVEATIELELVVDTSRPEGIRVQLVDWHAGSGWAGEESREEAR